MRDLMRQFLYSSVFALLTITPALSSQSDYDGRWAIVATTDQGQCVKGFELSVRILKGKAYVVGRSVNGAKTAVNSRGLVDIKFVDGSDVITAKGALKKRSGSGHWAYPTFRCTGRWQAKRQ